MQIVPTFLSEERRHATEGRVEVWLKTTQATIPRLRILEPTSENVRVRTDLITTYTGSYKATRLVVTWQARVSYDMWISSLTDRKVRI